MNGKILKPKLDVEFCLESHKNWHRIFTSGQRLGAFLIVCVLFMNSIVVRVHFCFAFVRVLQCAVLKGVPLHVLSILFVKLSHDSFYILKGEDVRGTSFSGFDEVLIRRALSILEQQGKCILFQGNTSTEDGVKFLD